MEPNTAIIGKVRMPATMEGEISRFRSRSGPIRKRSRAAISREQMVVVGPYPGNARSMTGHCNPPGAAAAAQRRRGAAAAERAALYLYTLWECAYSAPAGPVLGWCRLRPYRESGT